MCTTARLLLVLSALLLSACPPPRLVDDDDDDDATESASIPDLLEHHAASDIHPTELGMQFGLSECSIEYGANLELMPDAALCEGCTGVWEGPITSSFTTCSGTDLANSVRFGFALVGVELDVWSWSYDDSVWSHSGTAPRSVNGWMLESSEGMGEGDLNFGTIDTISNWE